MKDMRIRATHRDYDQLVIEYGGPSRKEARSALAVARQGWVRESGWTDQEGEQKVQQSSRAQQTSNRSVAPDSRTGRAGPFCTPCRSWQRLPRRYSSHDPYRLAWANRGLNQRQFASDKELLLTPHWQSPEESLQGRSSRTARALRDACLHCLLSGDPPPLLPP